MALSSAFRERLQHMEDTRNQRLSLLQGEKDLQVIKSQMLESKLVNIRSMEQRCLMLDRHIAFQRFEILNLKSEIQNLDSKYQSDSHQLRVMKRGMEELEEMQKEKERFYELKCHEMKAFREDVEKFVHESKSQVNELRNQANELKSIFVKLQGNNGYLSNAEIAAAEMRKTQLVGMKEDLERKLESNYQIRSRLQNKLKEVIQHARSTEEKKYPTSSR
ncbi:uncharacterized protein [Euphorbia lathyris]|uniref:uncharacterized protein n=1 Tax=Euphorbia lathyris TaxID=212925 RepID=UPI003313DEC4